MNTVRTIVAISVIFAASVANAAEMTHHNAALAHEMMNNGQSPAHQQMAQGHLAQVGDNPASPKQPRSFSQMNEHEQAAVFHESLNNGQAFAHQAEAKAHRHQIPAL
ncbi:copper-binding protein [Klebsiella aerogenes]|uniref:copper-binding protein n=1 Tax=Klebsiella aerogenes TaxID=548 RepID=UPI000D9E4604|nr:copper-binding protein [Klebsiella aerogenes]EIV2084514.1 copper-binding protein [Klebsiella aerogenes]EIW9212755.1 copper-binding protein [Klebsiella aerogenes]PYZ46352.1 copper-binding protein [Klebsiella aerogenes]HBS6037262.1 copper-binding protein [Klebsiella aerogenes]HCR0830519.1 copper-binding protein [Klebsiella aerogenes]